MPYKIVSLKRLIKSPKKYKVVLKDEDSDKTYTISFGSSPYQDYTQHKDPKRMALYLKRHKAREDWNDPTTAGWWSRWLLWSRPDFDEALNLVISKLSKISGGGRTKTYREKFNEKYGFAPDASHSLKDISDLTGYDLEGLKIILKKGEGAYYSNPQSVRPHITSATEWGIARIYSAVMGGDASRVDASHLIKTKSV